jgi:hypothetical protein
MKVFLIGVALGCILGAGLTFLYFSLATLFSANAKAALPQSKAAVPLAQEGEAVADESATDKTRSVGA